MGKPRNTIPEYLRKLTLTDHRVVLVEGTTDKRILAKLVNGLAADDLIGAGDLVIDTAEELESPQGQTMGNREKVEAVINTLPPAVGHRTIIGFVDREFREFHMAAVVEDKLATHFTSGRLIWSRGHSIENYFFDAQCLEATFRALTPPEFQRRTWVAFRELFPSVLLSAASVALAGRDLCNIRRVASTINWECLGIIGNEIAVNTAQWRPRLLQVWPAADADKVIERYEHWKGVLEHSSGEVVRWLTHGHVGFCMIWHSYARCAFEVSGGDARVPERIVSVREDVRINLCADSWVQRVAANTAPYPDVLMKVLGVTK